MPLGGVADDGRRLAVARAVAELLERGVDAVVLRGVHVDAPSSRTSGRPAPGPAWGRPCGCSHVELPVVAVHHHAQVVQLLLAGEHHRFPDRTFLQFAVAAHAVGIESRRDAARNRKALRHAEALPHGTGRDVDARQDRPGMAVEDARVGAGITQDLAIEVTEVGVDRGQGGDRVPLAEDEEILPAARRDRRCR